MRSFIAIALPEKTRDALGALQKRVRVPHVSASWPAAANIHLTLRFLGDVEEADLERLSADFEPRCRACGSMVLAPRGVGFFPNSKRPSVLWAGLEMRQGNLEALAQAAEIAARGIGLAPETKRFHPHLTLARIRDPRGAGPLIEAAKREQAFETEAFSVEKVGLYRSDLSPHGAVYTCLREFELNE